ncbi:FAD-dependent oxidoreductase [Pigmentibacter ruber]|nr:hypothetical protein GTC16762_07520 [Pigmentibacter ruber]
METESYDIVIVGAGPYACFSALFLSQQNFKIAIIHPENTEPLDTFIHSLQICWPSLNDPPTRANVAHGNDVAKYLQEFCANGANIFFQNILNILDEKQNWQQLPCYRIGMQDFEYQELEEASKLGFNLSSTDDPKVFKELFNSLQCLNAEKFKKTMLDYLQENKVKFIKSRVKDISEKNDGCTIILENKMKLNAEVIILANALKISEILNKYKEILIPMSDCLLEYSFYFKDIIFSNPISFRAANGHFAGTIFQRDQNIFMKFTGPRFLLPSAGAGIYLDESKITQENWEKIINYHSKVILSFLKTHFEFPFLNNIDELNMYLIKKNILVDCYPCDELPLLGEFGKLGKILGNTGWLATGFSAGVWAAYITHELIMHEKSYFLHSRLHPRRFFTRFIKS